MYKCKHQLPKFKRDRLEMLKLGIEITFKRLPPYQAQIYAEELGEVCFKYTAPYRTP